MVSSARRSNRVDRPRLLQGAALVAVAFSSFGCARVMPASPYSPPPPQPSVSAVPAEAPAEGWLEDGVASWYGTPYHGRTTASGETYDMNDMTAAHRTLPFGTLLRVQNLDNGLVTNVRVNDRGPFIEGRNLDLSRRAAREIDMLGPGTARVRLTVVGGPAQVSLSSCWMVQAGQYGEAEEAALVRRSLERDGHPVRVTTGSRGLHRVRAGPLDSRSVAEDLTRRVNGMLLNCEGVDA